MSEVLLAIVFTNFWRALGSIDYSIVTCLVVLSIVALIRVERLQAVSDAASVLAIACAVSSLLWLVVYSTNLFCAWYSNSFVYLVTSPYAAVEFFLFFSMAILPHAYWFSIARSNTWIRLLVALPIFAGHVFEYYVITMSTVPPSG